MNLAMKDVRHNWGRFGLSIAGIGLLLMSMMGMAGVHRGLVADATLLINRVGADLWIVKRGTRGPFAEMSMVPKNLLYRATVVPGVAEAKEFVLYFVRREHEGQKLYLAVLGLSWPTDKGDWLPLVAGRPLRRGHFEMIADETLKLPLGTRVKLGKETYTVVGITRGMVSLVGDGMGVFTVSDAQAIQSELVGEATRLQRILRLLKGENSELGRQQPSLIRRALEPPSEAGAGLFKEVSAVTVKVAPGADAAAVAETISGWGDVSVITKDDQCKLLLENNIDKARRQIELFSTLLTTIGAIVMALILYTLTLEKIRSIALLKLIGAPTYWILGMIFQQSLVLGVLGYCIAYLAGRKVFPYFPRRVILANEDLLQLAIVVLIVSISSCSLGIWKTLRIHPSEVLSG